MKNTKMRFWAAAVAFVSALSVAGSVRAYGVTGVPEVIPTLSSVPGATLLLPYFEVDLANPGGATTRFWVNNASATAILAHATVWTDLAVPVMNFDMYLTGYDMQQVDMRNILAGHLPQTASAGQDPQDQISPKGPASQDINFATCNIVGHKLPPANLSPSVVTGIRNALTGAASAVLGGKCGGRVSGTLARGYVTIDTVNACNTHTPQNADYFSHFISYQNVMWGDFVYVHSNANVGLIHGIPLVAVEASNVDPQTSTLGNYTFYGRYPAGFAWQALDHREPLGATFAARFVNNVTSVIAWRDPKVPTVPFTCGTTPPWYPLGREHLALFDEQEHVTVRGDSPASPTTHGNTLPAATQKVLVGSASLPSPYASGWMFLDLNATVTPAGPNPTQDPAAAQAYVLTVRNLVAGSFGNIGMEGGPADRLDSAANSAHTGPPLPPPGQH